jgi:hypothetical protein
VNNRVGNQDAFQMFSRTQPGMKLILDNHNPKTPSSVPGHTCKLLTGTPQQVNLIATNPQTVWSHALFIPTQIRTTPIQSMRQRPGIITTRLKNEMSVAIKKSGSISSKMVVL